MRTWTLLIALILSLQNAVLPQRSGSIEGKVLESGTRRPLAGVTVQLRATGTSSGSALLIVTDTREDGTFALRNVPPGTYRIEAMRGGYIPAVSGDAKNAPTTSTIASGQSLSGISIMLTPGGVIYGRLVDDRGEVVVGASVEALKTAYKDGQRERRLTQTVITNDLGEYRLFMLAPGEYALRATPPSSESERPPFNKLEVVPVYFPGTIDSKEAQNIDVHAGEITGGINLLSFPTRTRRITGKVIVAGGGGAGVLLSPRNGTAPVEQTTDPVSGAFEFKNVIPGAYTLVAKSGSQRALVALDVGNVDLLNLTIAIGPAHQIPVHVHIEGHAAGDDPELEKLYFVARRDLPIAGLDLDVYSPFPNGRFTFDLLAADYSLDLEPEDFYIKSITLGDINVLNTGLHVSSSSGETMEILVGRNLGSVQGQAEKEATTVVLVPDPDRRAQRALYKFVRVGASREFHFTKVPPGEYKLFAWREENGGPWLDPEYIGRYESRGIPVHVEENQMTVSDRPIPLLD